LTIKTIIDAGIKPRAKLKTVLAKKPLVVALAYAYS